MIRIEWRFTPDPDNNKPERPRYLWGDLKRRRDMILHPDDSSFHTGRRFLWLTAWYGGYSDKTIAKHPLKKALDYPGLPGHQGS